MIREKVYENTIFQSDQVAIEASGYDDGGITLRIKVRGNLEVGIPLTLAELEELADDFGMLHDSMEHLTTPDSNACPKCGHARYESTIVLGELLCPVCSYVLSTVDNE